jgi:hypothetical protein
VSERKLKLWNAPWYPFQGQTLNVAAYSQKDALALLHELFPRRHFVTLGEIQKFWSPCWGNSMQGITPERGAWLERERFAKPVRVMPP